MARIGRRRLFAFRSLRTALRPMPLRGPARRLPNTPTTVPASGLVTAANGPRVPDHNWTGDGVRTALLGRSRSGGGDPGHSCFVHGSAAAPLPSPGASKRRDPNARPVCCPLRRLPLPVVLDRPLSLTARGAAYLALGGRNIARGGLAIWRERFGFAAHFQPRAKQQPVPASLLEVSLSSRPALLPNPRICRDFFEPQAK